MPFGLKNFLIGRPLASAAFKEEKLSIPAGLAILSSDALSSVAYATEEIVLVLGAVSMHWSSPISMVILGLLAIVIVSYRQTIKAYPQGGGAYFVSKGNLGINAGLTAAAALMIDYILTVTVSVSAGIAALISAFPDLAMWRVPLCIACIIFIAILNLRGLRSSGSIFLIPTYIFVVLIFVLIGTALYQQAFQLGGTERVANLKAMTEMGEIQFFLVLRAFSAGCTALTGVEAISDGVTIFKEPEWVNARKTLLIMGLILGFMFIGITYLANFYSAQPSHDKTLLAELAGQIFGVGHPLFYGLQFATLGILILAANTSFADFPRLASFLAKDGFLPRQLSLFGDRLVFTNGIVLLSVTSILLAIAFQGQVSALIPLYAVGVFTSFTLSQSGMVVRWFKRREPGWVQSMLVNGLGAIATALVLVVIVSTKFLNGAWLVVVCIPLMVQLFHQIHWHYIEAAGKLGLKGAKPQFTRSNPELLANVKHHAIVLVGSLNKGTIAALDYAQAISKDIVAIHINLGNTDCDELHKRWKGLDTPVPLVILDSPFRSLVEPLAEFVSRFEASHPGGFSTIIIPNFVTGSFWENSLHNQTTWFLEQALRSKKSRVITTVNYYLK